MKYFIVSLCAVFMMVTYKANAQQGKLLQHYLIKQFSRNAAPNTGPVPDYSDLYYWAASPFKHDPSDRIPSFLKGTPRDSSVDVFFIHPTSYTADKGNGQKFTTIDLKNNRRALFAALKKTSWNADLSDTFVNRQTDTRSILYQASVFNGRCRVFAPRYRQANIKAFFVPHSSRAQQAFDLAYSDVKNAFEYYLNHDNHGRPIIIASHSQGTLLAERLLRAFFDGKPLQSKLVCAYIIGHQIPKDAFQNIPVCPSPTATGCFVGWRSYVQGTTTKRVRSEDGNSVCVNPLTWTTSTKLAPKSLNRGSMARFNTLIPHSVGARITPKYKILWVTFPDTGPPEIKRLKKMKNLHVFDYNLFWMNIRENVKDRVEAYLQKHP